MRMFMRIVGLIAIGVNMAMADQTFEKDIEKTSAGDLVITFIGHGTLMMEFQGKVVHIDPYTMTPEMVAHAARALRPRVLYPYHYGETDTTELVDLLKDETGIEIRIRQMRMRCKQQTYCQGHHRNHNEVRARSVPYSWRGVCHQPVHRLRARVPVLLYAVVCDPYQPLRNGITN